LVYNFEPTLYHNNNLCCTLDTVIRPLNVIDDTNSLIGRPFTLFINGTTSEVCNSTKGMMDVGLVTPEEANDMEPPKTYGKFTDYMAICGYIAISCQVPIESDPLFFGKLDKKDYIQSCTAHTSFVEAREALAKHQTPYQYIGELICPKQVLPEILKVGIGRFIIKLMNPQGQELLLTPVIATLNMEVNAKDEIRLYGEAILEPFTPFIIEHKS
jgi:hypothetical protein